MGYGDALGYNFRIGRDQIPQPSQMAEESVTSDPEVGQYDKNDLLANRSKLTQDVYENMSILRNYAQELAKKGIDVTKPDFTQEGGGPEHLAYLKLDAAVKHATNALKNEYLAEQQLRPLEAEGKIRFNQGVDRSGNYMQNPENYYSTAPLENVKEANIRGRENSYTPQDQARINAVIAREAEQIDEQVRQGYLSKEAGNLQKSYLVNNAYTTPASAFSDSGRGSGKNDFQIGLLRKYTNLSQGVWNPGTYTKKVIDGKVYLINEDGRGDSVGKYQAGVDSNGNPVIKDKIVKWWRLDPATNQVEIEFTDNKIPSEIVSNKSGDAVTRDFVSSNPKYGSVDKFMETARNQGLLDSTGSLINSTLMPLNADQIKNQVSQLGKESSEKVEGVRTAHVDQLKGVKDPFLFFRNNSTNFKTPDGDLIVGKHRGKDLYYIDNWKDFYKNADESEFTKLSSDKVVQILTELGAYEDVMSQKASEVKKINLGGKKAY